MTLQNKNNQFLSSAQEDASDDALDIFAQYGTDDAQAPPQPTDERSADEVEGDVQKNMTADQQNTQENTDEPEDLFEQFDDTDQDGDDNTSTEVTAEEGEMRAWEEKMENDKNGSTVPSSLPVVDDPVPAQVVASDHEDALDAEKPKNDASVKDTSSPDVDHVQKREELVTDVTDETESEVVDEQAPAATPVAPPMRENINAVVQSDNDHNRKKSFLPNEKRPTQTQPSIDPGKKTIAIVDDDVDTLDMYASIFESADYNVLRASDGLEALSVISEHTPHLIFTGIVMPRMDGFTMMEALKQNKRTADIPVVINSHLGRDADRKRAEELGARDFIVRGFTPPREALERIGALLLRSEYTFRFDVNDPEARKLVRDLGASNFFVCPRGQEMVIKLSVSDPKNLTFSARFSCVDEQKKK